MKSTHRRLTNKLEIQADEVSIAFEGSLNNSVDILSRIAKFYGKGPFSNLAKIEAEEGVSILVKNFWQGIGTEKKQLPARFFCTRETILRRVFAKGFLATEHCA